MYRLIHLPTGDIWESPSSLKELLHLDSDICYKIWSVTNDCNKASYSRCINCVLQPSGLGFKTKYPINPNEFLEEVIEDDISKQ